MDKKENKLVGGIRLDQPYDIVIVGAGVSGLSAGYSASLNGAKTLIVERKKEIGAIIRCGEFVYSQNEIKKLLPNASSLKKLYMMLSKESICNTTNKIRVFSPQNRKYEFTFDGLVLERSKLEKTIAKETERAGATIQTSTVVKGIEKKGNVTKVLIQNVKGKTFVKTRLLIGADAFPSKIAKWTNLKSTMNPSDISICAQRHVYDAKIDENAMELYFGKKYAPGGLAWVIPKGGGTANIGIGVRLPYMKRGLHVVDYLNTLLTKHPIVSTYLSNARSKPMIAKTLPVCGLFQDIYRNKILLTGDAAGAVIATNGSGIPTAFVSGHIAGKMASKYIKGNNELLNYATVLKSEIGQVLQRGYLYRKFGDFFVHSDAVFEVLMRIIGTNNIAKVIKCSPSRSIFH